MNTLICGLIQTELTCSAASTAQAIGEQLLAAQLPLISQAGARGVQVLCLQEVFSPGNCCAAAESFPAGRALRLMRRYAKEYRMVIIVPVAAMDRRSAAVIDADGAYLGTIPATRPAGALRHAGHCTPAGGYAVFATAYCKLGVYLCNDRPFPEDWRALALNGAEYIVDPSANGAENSSYLCQLEHRSAAIANGIFVAAIKRVVKESPWDGPPGERFTASYIVNPLGQLEAQAIDRRNSLLVHSVDLDQIRAVRSNWRRRTPHNTQGLDQPLRFAGKPQEAG